MRKFCWTFLLFIYVFGFSQQRIVFISATGNEQKVIDSVFKSDTKFSLKEIENQAKKIQQGLFRKGFLSAEINPKSSSDSLFIYDVKLGKRQNYILINVDENIQKELQLKALEKIKLQNLESFIKKLQMAYDALGYSFHQLALNNFKAIDQILHADLIVIKDNQRLLNHVVWQGIERFPKNHQKFVKKTYVGLPFSQGLISRMEKDIENFSFCQLVKVPEILFGSDSTKVYFTVDKKKTNQFDGYAGFSTDDNNQLRFNGHLDLSLTNLIGSGEHINLYWRNNGEEQTQFNAKLSLLYLFGTRFTTVAEINIMQQDSTFQNSQTKWHVGYQLAKARRIFVGYETMSSNNISSTSNLLLNDFESSFGLLTFTNYPLVINHFQRPEDLYVMSEFGYGKRKDNLSAITQLRLKVNTEKNIKINDKQNLWLRNENFYLLSDNYLINELHRFGGNQSIRGYLETSLQANQYYSLLTEYQYFFNSSFYLHSILDYGFYEDKTSNFSNQLLSSGIGFGFLSRNGILKFNYVNPIVGQDGFKLSNSIVHIQFRSVF